MASSAKIGKPGDTLATPRAPAPPRRPRRWLRRLVVLAVVGGLLYLARGPLLRGLGSFLVVEDADETTEYVLVLGGSNCFEEAVRRQQQGQAANLMVLESPPSRLERLHIYPSITERMKAFMKDRVSDDRLTVVHCEGGLDWSRVRTLRTWMEQHPEARITILCPWFESRRLYCLFGQVLPGESMQRLRWHPLRYRKYDETSWWHHKGGTLDVFSGYVGYGFVRFHGEETEERGWDPDQYEKDLP